MGIALVLYWNIAGLSFLTLQRSQTFEVSPQVTALFVGGLFLSIGIFFFAVASSPGLRSVAFHPDRSHHYKPRDVIAFGAYFTLPALLALSSYALSS